VSLDTDGPDPPGRAPCVRIVHLSGPAFAALADGELKEANRFSPVPLTPYFAGPAWAGIWRMRRDQVMADPQSAAWVTGVTWDELLGSRTCGW